MEEKWLQQGKTQGEEAGRQKGLQHGLDVGIQKGGEVGKEIGFYAGCAAVWRIQASQEPQSVKPRFKKALAKLEKELQSYPLGEAQSEEQHNKLEDLRARFKHLLSLLGIHSQAAAAARDLPVDRFLQLLDEPDQADSISAGKPKLHSF
eukprot:g24719.t1